jgi:hypothetical protein
MAAPKGNQFWRARSSHGRKPIFATPDDLWEAASEYFDWVEANPLWETKVTQYQGAPVDMPVAKMRAMTEDGLQIFLDISETCWTDYCQKEDFAAVTKRIKQIIRNQKFEGAAAELFNPNIIARDLGLKDKTEQELTGKNGGPIETQVQWTIQPVKPVRDDKPDSGS